MQLKLDNARAAVVMAALQGYVDRNDKLIHAFRTGGDTGASRVIAIASLGRHNIVALEVIRDMNEQEVERDADNRTG